MASSVNSKAIPILTINPSHIQSLNDLYLIKKGYKIEVGAKDNKPKQNMVHIEEKVKLQNENQELRKKVNDLQKLLQENRQSFLLVRKY